MASASPAALLTVSDRPMAERPEAKGPGAPDGQFAGLMAQLNQAPTPAKSPEPTVPGQSLAAKSSKAQSHKARLSGNPSQRPATTRHDPTPEPGVAQVPAQGAPSGTLPTMSVGPVPAEEAQARVLPQTKGGSKLQMPKGADEAPIPLEASEPTAPAGLTESPTQTPQVPLPAAVPVGTAIASLLAPPPQPSQAHPAALTRNPSIPMAGSIDQVVSTAPVLPRMPSDLAGAGLSTTPVTRAPEPQSQVQASTSQADPYPSSTPSNPSELAHPQALEPQPATWPEPVTQPTTAPPAAEPQGPVRAEASAPNLFATAEPSVAPEAPIPPASQAMPTAQLEPVLPATTALAMPESTRAAKVETAATNRLPSPTASVLPEAPEPANQQPQPLALPDLLPLSVTRQIPAIPSPEEAQTGPGNRLLPAPASDAPETPNALTSSPLQIAEPTPAFPSTQTAPIAEVQAVLAEASSESWEKSKVERGSPALEAPRAEGPLAAPIPAIQRSPQELPLGLAPSVVKESSPSGPAVPQPAPDSTGDQPRGPALQPHPTAPAAAEVSAPKADPAAQPSTLRAADGSSLAALTALPRTPESASPTIPVPPAPPTPPAPPVLQVEGGLKWMLKGGTQEAQLQLHPESLGQVTIHLKVAGGEVHARLWITEPASVQAVRDGRPHLEQALREQGLQLGSFDLQQGNRPFQEASPAPAGRERSLPEAPPTRQEAPASLPVSILNPHHVELYA